MSAQESALRELLRDANVRLDEQRRMTDAAEARFETAVRRWEDADFRAMRAEARLRRVERLADEWSGRAHEATSEPLSWRRVARDLRDALAEVPA